MPGKDNMNLQNVIGWCTATWSPVIGCSNNCVGCWAEKMAHRLAMMGEEGYAYVTTKEGKWNGKIFSSFCKTRFTEPLRLKRPQKIFVCDMGDLFCNAVNSEKIQAVIETVKLCPQHIFQFLTQNPARYSEFEWPDNCWLGTTVRTQEEAHKRIPLLLKVKAKIKFLSIEPCLEEIYLPGPLLLHGFGFAHNQEPERIDWIIVGCATDSRAKNCKLKWIKDIVRHCGLADISVWVKQVVLNGKVIKNIDLFPKNLQIRQFPVDR